MGMIRDSFVVLKTWGEAIKALPEEYRLECYESLFQYGLTGEMPEDISAIAKALLISFSRGMENNIARYHASVISVIINTIATLPSSLKLLKPFI